MIENKEMYTFEELCRGLEISMSQFSKRSNTDEGTIARIRQGNFVRLSTANKLLRAFSEIYGIKFTLDNVSGLTLQNNVARKPAMVPVRNETADNEPVLGDLQISPTTRKPGGAPKSDIPAELPPGTVKLFDFIKENELSGSNISKYVNNGYKGEKIETTTIPRASGLGGVSHFLTPEQQVKAIALLKKWGKWKKQDQSTQQEKPWYSPDSE